VLPHAGEQDPGPSRPPLIAERLAPVAPVAPVEVTPAAPAAVALVAIAPATVASVAPSPAAAPVAVLTHTTIGGHAGHLDLADPRWSRDGGTAGVLLESRADVLPELEDDVPPRRITRQPAFIVALAAAVVVVVVVVILVLMQTVFRGPDRVENLQLLDGGDNYILQWNGPDVPYAVTMTGATGGKTEDVSNLVKNGRQAWIPKSGADVTDDSCFVVRAQRETTQKLPTAKAALAGQGAARVCIADVKAQ
jgi:hypothetical protein